MIPSFATDFSVKFLAAWQEGNRSVRIAVVISLISIVLGIIINGVDRLIPQSNNQQYSVYYTIGMLLILIGAVFALLVYLFQYAKDAVQKENKLVEVEKRVQENPKESQAAWELARIKLESYLDRNLSQVNAIFWLSAIVMIVGFVLIGFGVYFAYFNSINFKVSILTTSSGILVNFIGGTFLILYKATMAQAKDYVTILERINAVGMSVHILDTLKDEDISESNLKQETTASIALNLLLLYSGDVYLSRIKTDEKTRVKQTV